MGVDGYLRPNGHYYDNETNLRLQPRSQRFLPLADQPPGVLSVWLLQHHRRQI